MASTPDLRKKVASALKRRQAKVPPAELRSSPAVFVPEPAPEPVPEPIPEPIPKPIAEPKHEPLKQIQEHAIEDFTTISELKVHLSDCAARNTDFHLINAQPEKVIINFVLSEVRRDPVLHAFNESLGVLDLTKQISTINNQKYLNYTADLISLLSLYENKVSQLLNTPTHEGIDELHRFFDTYQKNERVKQLRAEHKNSINPFTVEHRLKNVIESLDNASSKLTKIQESTSRQASQKDYAQLLTMILEGGAPVSISPLLGPAATQETEAPNTLLPDTEFAPPSAEPEDPGRIGINKTMSFIPPKDRASILKAFSSDSLKNDFLNAFKWAANSHTLNKLPGAVFSQDVDLLNTDFPLAKNIQFAVIRYLLLSLDVLGKVSGTQGDLALQNYPLIKDVSEDLLKLSEHLKNITTTDDPDFLNELNEMTAYLASKNQSYNFKNIDINGFCHINERLSSLLLNIPYEQSVLSPAQPSSKLLAKMNRALGIGSPPKP